MAPYAAVRTLILFTAAISIAACGASTTTAGHNANGSSTQPGGAAQSATAPKACTLITQAQAQAALGEAVDAGKPSDLASIDGCIWGASDSSKIGDTVIIDYVDQASFSASKATSGRGGLTVETVNGLGDEAFYQTAGQITILEVRKGSLIISVGVERDGASQRDAEKSVAQSALAALP